MNPPAPVTRTRSPVVTEVERPSARASWSGNLTSRNGGPDRLAPLQDENRKEETRKEPLCPDDHESHSGDREPHTGPRVEATKPSSPPDPDGADCQADTCSERNHARSNPRLECQNPKQARQ